MLGPQLSKNILNNWFTPCGVLWTWPPLPTACTACLFLPQTPFLFRALSLWSLQPYFEYILSLGPGSVDKYHKTESPDYPINPNLPN